MLRVRNHRGRVRSIDLGIEKKPVREAVLDTHYDAVTLHDQHWAMLGGTQSKTVPSS